MHAIRVAEFGDPSVMVLASAPDLVPAPGQVVVNLAAAGVNPVDTYIRAGTYAHKPTLPYIPGIDGAGTVAAVGEGVTTWRVGDRVYGGWPLSGTYADSALYAADQLYPLPDTLAIAHGAGVFVPYSTAYRALFQKAQAQPGETVLIHGATGAVGLAATQLAIAAGLTVLGTGGTAAGRDIVAQQGAAHVLDHHQPDYLAQVRHLTGGRGVDVVIEMLANVNLGHDLSILAPGGRVVIVGNRGDATLNPRDLMACDGQIMGFTLFNTPPDALARIQPALFAGLKARTLRPIIQAEFPLAQAPDAHEAVLAPGSHGKILLIPSGDRGHSRIVEKTADGESNGITTPC